MSIFNKVRVIVLGHVNDLLDKAIDMNSLSAVRQYVRDLEEAQTKVEHEAAVAAANVTTLTKQHTALDTAIGQNLSRIKAYLAQNNEAAARALGGTVHDEQQELASLDAQITEAKANSQSLDTAAEQIKARHQQMLSQVRTLESKDRSSHALEQSTAALKGAQTLTEGVDGASVDNLAQKINARNDVAQEEFKRTMGGFAAPEDPLKTAAVDDLLNSLRTPAPATA